eukprot:gene35009-45319_t
MFVWVQSRSGNEQAFKVDITNDMDCADLKEAITLKRKFLNLAAGAVLFIYSENSEEERFKLRAGAKVPIPIDGQIGSSDYLPYYFSLTQTHAASTNSESQPAPALAPETCFRVTAKLSNGKKYSGHRKTVFQHASSCHAMYNEPAAQSIWYPTGSSDLHVSLRFKLEENAVSFIGRLSEMKCYYSVLDDNIEINELPETLLLVQPASYVFPHHYRKVDSTSPNNSRADTVSMTSEVTNDSDPDKALRSVEDLTKLEKGAVVNRCHIAPKAYFKEFEGDKDNLIFGSNLFHKRRQETAQRKACNVGSISSALAGDIVHWINVRIHFRDPAIAREMQWRLRSGTATDGDTCFITYFYSSNAANTVKYLAIKKAETQQRWKVAADMETEVEDEDEDGDEG